jgi:hypothetical protein
MPYTTDEQEFLNEQDTRLKTYYSTNKIKLVGFENRERFIDWYLHELHINNNKCHYCKTSILEIRNLLNSGIISGRNVGGTGIRGHNLEIDRMQPGEEYSEVNCVLSCYYCNNDKSNTFSYDVYRNIIGPSRKIIWENLTISLR